MVDKYLQTERAKFADKDAKQLEDFVMKLNAFNFAVIACGKSGEDEYKKLIESAPSVIKALVNYL